MTNISQRLRTSVSVDACNGDRFDRAVCTQQMLEAARRLDALEAENAALRARIAEQDASPEVAIGSTCEFPGCTSEATVWNKPAHEEAWFLCSHHWHRWKEAHP